MKVMKPPLYLTALTSAAGALPVLNVGLCSLGFGILSGCLKVLSLMVSGICGRWKQAQPMSARIVSIGCLTPPAAGLKLIGLIGAQASGLPPKPAVKAALVCIGIA
jgi:hypothetical protein